MYCEGSFSFRDFSPGCTSFKYHYHVSDRSVQCTIKTENLEMTVLFSVIIFHSVPTSSDGSLLLCEAESMVKQAYFVPTVMVHHWQWTL